MMGDTEEKLIEAENIFMVDRRAREKLEQRKFTS